MTRAHRRRHLITWLVLSPAIVGMLIMALVVRARGLSELSHATPNAREVRP